MYIPTCRCHQILQNGPCIGTQELPNADDIHHKFSDEGEPPDNKSPQRANVLPIHHVAVGERGTMSSPRRRPADTTGNVKGGVGAAGRRRLAGDGTITSRIGYIFCGAHLSLPLVINPMTGCRLLRLMERGVFPRLLYMQY